MSSAISPLALPHSRALPISATAHRTMTKTLTVTLFLPFARLMTSRNCPGLTGRVLVEVCSLRSSRDRAWMHIPGYLLGSDDAGDGRLVTISEPAAGAERPLSASCPVQFGDQGQDPSAKPGVAGIGLGGAGPEHQQVNRLQRHRW